MTDKSYEQFIYVNRAANKWRKKVEKRKEAEKSSMLTEGTVTVNVGYGLDPVLEETKGERETQTFLLLVTSTGGAQI